MIHLMPGRPGTPVPPEFNQTRFDFGVAEIGPGEQLHALCSRAVANVVEYP